MAKFIPYDYNQNAMVVVNFKDQIQPGTFEHALHYLIEEKLDLSVFDPEYHNDDSGRPAYSPGILLKIILFAYSKGITSSREIEWCCKSNIIFKALSCDTVPHFTTIASFVSSFAVQIESVFEQVLLVCHQQGLLGNELFAIDGCKLPSNAAKQWSGTFKELTAKPRMGKAKKPQEVKSNITDNDSAKMTTSKGTIQGYNGIAAIDSKHQIVIAATALGEGQEQHSLQPVLADIQDRFKRLKISKNLYKAGIVVTGKPWDGAKRVGVVTHSAVIPSLRRNSWPTK